jgi:hypothetical protein
LADFIRLTKVTLPSDVPNLEALQAMLSQRKSVRVTRRGDGETHDQLYTQRQQADAPRSPPDSRVATSATLRSAVATSSPRGERTVINGRMRAN